MVINQYGYVGDLHIGGRASQRSEVLGQCGWHDDYFYASCSHCLATAVGGWVVQGLLAELARGRTAKAGPDVYFCSLSDPKSEARNVYW